MEITLICKFTFQDETKKGVLKMSDKSPPEIAQSVCEIGCKKTKMPFFKY